MSQSQGLILENDLSCHGSNYVDLVSIDCVLEDALFRLINVTNK